MLDHEYNEYVIAQREYYEEAVAHRNSHKCGGYPYSCGEFLTEITQKLGAKTILEIGTAVGYSAFCFASAAKNVSVTTIDMNQDHRPIANDLWQEYGVSEQITFVVGSAIDVLPTLDTTFDIIFFDGFAPLPELVDHYPSLLTKGGVVISTNLSWNDSTPKYLDRLKGQGFVTQQHNDNSFSSLDLQRVELCSDTFKKYETEAI